MNYSSLSIITTDFVDTLIDLINIKSLMPSRKAQKAIIEQRNLNPVLDSCG